jgi:CRISPR/Cas system CSM-associated protein Csm3 (group 7 of RAMP superfamily)
MSDNPNPMTGAKRLYLLGTIQTTAPLHIGWRAEVGVLPHETDQPVLLGWDGKPYIPGTSLSGVMRTVATQLVAVLKDWGLKDVLSLFGTARPKREEGEQSTALQLPSHPSKLRVRHARLKGDWRGWTEVRDGVGIDRKRGAARKGIKFDYEILPKGLEFDLWIELRDGNERDEALLAMVLTALETLPFSVGAKGGSGLGALNWRIKKAVRVDLTNKDDLLGFLMNRDDFVRQKEGQGWESWRTEVLKDFSFSVEENTPITRITQAFVFTYELTVQGEPLLIRGRAEPTMAFEALKERKGIETHRGKEALDAVWIGTGNEVEMTDWQPILPGSSLRGAFRSHCERILRTLSWHYTRKDLGEKADISEVYEEYCRRRAAKVDLWEGNGELRRKVEEVWEKQMKQKGLEEEQKWFEAGKEMAQIVWDGSDLAERLFGSTLWRSLVVVSEAYLKGNGFSEMLFDHLAVERFSGGALEHKKFDTLPVTEATFEGKVAVFGDEKWALGLIALLFKDLADGLVRIGSAKTRGFGKVTAKVTRVEAFLLPNSQLAKSLRMKAEKGKVWQYRSWQLQGKFPENLQSLPNDLKDLKDLLSDCVSELNEKVKNFRRNHPEGAESDELAHQGEVGQ